MRQVFDFAEYGKLEKMLGQFPHARDSLLMLEFPLLNKDKKALSDLSYALQARSNNFRSRIRKYYLEPLEAGIKLIKALKKEYHLK